MQKWKNKTWMIQSLAISQMSIDGHNYMHSSLTSSIHDGDTNTSGINRQQIKPGDIVLMHDDTPRITWKLAVIEELMKGKDGLVRAAKIRTSQGRTNRPIARLIPLEVSLNVTGESTADEEKDVQPPPDDANTTLPPADRDGVGRTSRPR